MKPILTLILGLISILGFSQTPTISFQKIFGGSSNEFPYDMIQLPNGDLVVCGSSNSDISGNKTENGFGGKDYWVFQIAPDGTIEWQMTLGGAMDDVPSSIIQTPDGGFLINGYSNSPISGNKTSSNYGSWDVWLVKISSVGQLEWQKNYGGQDTDVGGPMLVLPNSNILICNSSTSGVSGTKTKPSKGGHDVWVLTVDELGNVIREEVYGGSGSEIMNDVQLISANRIVFTGRSDSDISGDKNQNSFGGTDYWTLITDIDGGIHYSSTEGGDYFDGAKSVVSRNNELVLFGRSSSDVSGSKTVAEYGFGDFWCVGLDSNLNRKWETVLGGSSMECKAGDVAGVYYSAIHQYVICGSSLSDVSGNKTMGAFDVGYGDLWMVGLDTFGVKQFEFVAGGDGEDLFGQIIASNNNTLIVVGLTWSGISGNKTEANYGEGDIWLIELDFQVSIKVVVNNTDLKAFPNPTSTVLTFSLPMTVNHSEVSLTDMTGKVVYSKRLERVDQSQIDVSNMPNGMYVLSVLSKEFQYTRKVVIE